jgi:uncharacterized protein (DUF1330 family)
VPQVHGICLCRIGIDFEKNSRLDAQNPTGESSRLPSAGTQGFQESGKNTMEKRFIVAVALSAGVVMSAAGSRALHAQAKPPVYMIALNEVMNAESYGKEYLPPARDSIKAYGGTIVAAGPGTEIEGTLPGGRVVVLRWESMEALQRWRNSPEYGPVHKTGLKYAKYNIVAVDGIAQ